MFSVIPILSLKYAHINPFLYTGIFVAFLSIYSVFYWLPYYIDFADLLKRKDIGVHMAVYKNIIQVVGAMLPVIGGLIISIFGFGDVFAFSAFIFLITIIPS